MTVFDLAQFILLPARGAALTTSTLKIPHDPQADLCIRAGYIALRRIAAFFDLPYDEDPPSH